jgi:transcriptional regulator with GAF, ATPase, and Fis domain
MPAANHAEVIEAEKRPGRLLAIHGHYVESAASMESLKEGPTAVIEAHVAFQGVVADIALELARTASADLDDVITNSLRQLAEALQLDRATLWHKGGVEWIATATHYWSGDSHPPPPMSAESLPFVISKLQAGKAVWFSRVAELPDPIDRRTILKQGLRSGAVLPVSTLGDSPGSVSALTFLSTTGEYEWGPAVVDGLRLVAGVLSQALSRRVSEASLARAFGELQQLRAQLAGAPAEVRRDVRTTRTPRLIVSESPSAKRSLAQVQQVAPTTATVLLRGETGTGKEVFAQAIHDLSPRHQRPMVIVSCAAIPSALIESELFGRERGAFTGALSRQIGRFEAANQSTLFLDEIGELPMEMQVKLLRVLQDRTIERLGSTQPIKVDVRIIAATNRDLEAAVHDGTFREDLFYRLDVFPVEVPPLRERAEDIPGLLWSFVDEFSRAFGKTIDSIPNANVKELQHYTWPGNIRELRNAVERAVILSTGRQLVVPVPTHSMRVARPAVPSATMTLEALEIEHIRAVLATTSWRVRGPGGAAERLGLKPTTLDSRMARLGISRSAGGSDSKRSTIKPS